jgi:hypothetical protein
MKILHKIICILILLIIVYLVYIFLNKQEKFEDINLEPLQNSFIIEDTNIVNNTIKVNNNAYDISGINNKTSIIEKERRYSNNYKCNIDMKVYIFKKLINNYFSHLLNGTDEEKSMVYQSINMINEDGFKFLEPDLIPDNSIIYNSKLDSNSGWLDIYDEEKKPYIEIELTIERIINGIIIQSLRLPEEYELPENSILVSDFIVETSNDGIIWEALKDKNNETEPKLFHIDYENTETVKKINTETNEIGTNGNEDITTYEIVDYDKKYSILIENFIKCKYIRVYPIKYYINQKNYSNDNINIISNDNYKTYFVDNETLLCDNSNPMLIGMRLGLLTTEYIPTTQPSTTQPSTTQPSTTQPSTTQPSTTQPSTTQPSTTQPSTTQPSTTQPSTTQPSTTQPSTTQPSTTQPSTTQPSTTQPLIIQPQPLGSNDFNIGMMLKGNNNEGNLNDFLSKNTMLGNDIYISPNGISGNGFDNNDDFFEESSNNKIIDSSFYPMIDLQ